MTDELDQRVNIEVRTRLRAAINALVALRDFCKPDDGFAAQHHATCHALEYLENDFPEDVRGQCEGCLNLILYGDQGHPTEDGCTLCEKCSPAWDDIKAQWDEGNREEEEDGDKARFLEAYTAHIAGGGAGTDKVLYTL